MHIVYKVVTLPEKKYQLVLLLKIYLRVTILSPFVYSIYRTEAMGYVQITSRLGAMLSPWVAEGLDGFSWRMPFILMGALSIVVAFLLHFLPETRDMKTAEFLENDVKQEGKFGLTKRKKRDKQKLSLVPEEDEKELEA